MRTIEVVVPRLHKAQTEIIDSAARFNAIACGRRFGKTTLGIERLADPAVLTYPTAYFAPSYKDMLEVWRECVRVFKPITRRKNAQERRIEFLTDGILEFWSLDNPDAGRGRKYKRVVTDEAALINALVEIWHGTIRPTLADYSGDAWFLSTPKGHNGFWQLYQYGIDETRPEWASFKRPTWENPYINQGEIDAMRREMPERLYQQEVCAEFLESAGGVFRHIKDTATATPQESAIDGHDYVIGVDWAQRVDFTVFAVVDATTNELVYLDRFQQIDYRMQVDRLAALCDRFRPMSVIAEENSMIAVIEMLAERGLPVQPFKTTQASKHQAIQMLSAAFDHGDIQILDDPILIGELMAFEGKVTKTNLLSYSAPDGGHDDTVMALALAWQGTAATMPAFL